MSGRSRRILNTDTAGITGCSDTALETIVVTCGSRPAAAAMAKDVEPWQWMTAFIDGDPLTSLTYRTAAGWSQAAASSRVQATGSRSMEARQLSSHTSQPSSMSASTSVRSTGGRKISPRTPAPWTRITGSRVGSCRPLTRRSVTGCPSRAEVTCSVVRWSVRVVGRIGTSVVIGPPS